MSILKHVAPNRNVECFIMCRDTVELAKRARYKPPVMCGEIYSDVSSCHVIISEGKFVDINLIGIFGGMRCRLKKRRPLRVFD